MFKLSIVITTKNRKRDLIECIDSIKKSTFKDYEIIIVDDVSNDGTEDLTPEDFTGLSLCVLHQKEPLMMVKARNLGAKTAKGKYILFIDDDNIIDNEMLAHLVTAAEEFPSYGILGPSMYYFDSKKKYMDYQTFNFYTGRTRGLLDSSHKSIIESDGVPNVFLIKKEVFEKCGFFDKKLIQTFTEPDFAFNARVDFKCGMVKKAITYHKISEGVGARAMGAKFNQKAYCLMRNRSVLIARYGTLLQKIVYLLFFSWLWPLLYSILMFKDREFYLIKFYMYGFRDGLIYFFSGSFTNSLPKLIKK